MISGFIVSVSVGSLQKTGFVSFMLFFYALRIQRIAPALLVCRASTALFTALIVPSAWLSESIARTGLFAFFGLSNLLLAKNSNDYFSPVAEFNPYTYIWLEAPKPIFRSTIYMCAESYRWSNPIRRGGTSMPRDLLLHLRSPVVAAFHKLQDTVPNIGIWDPFPLLCPQVDQCGAFQNGRPTFFDTDHVSGYGNRRLFPSFRDFILGVRGPTNHLKRLVAMNRLLERFTTVSGLTRMHHGTGLCVHNGGGIFYVSMLLEEMK